jgi:xanthine dehydrogenase accessory factor
MKEIFQGAITELSQSNPCVLATVVKTKGSTPQKTGAKLLIQSNGTSIGTLGGGCVEGDIWFAAKEIIKNAELPQFKEYYLNEDIAAKEGLVCGGTMYFFLHPLQSLNLPALKEALNAYKGGAILGIATIINSQDPSDLGKQILLREDGSTAGTLGAKDLDALTLELIPNLSNFGDSKYISQENGLDIFIEGYTTPPTLIIMGGGHVGKAIYNSAIPLEMDVYIVDDRTDYANHNRFPLAKGIVVSEFNSALSKIPINKNSYIVIATRGHRQDDSALESAIQTPARYVGLMGSVRKTLLIFKNLIAKGYSKQTLEKIYAPIGLSLGAITPEEIAISIMSEIIMVRHGGIGSSMKMKESLIEKIDSQAKGQKWEKSPHFS